MNNIAQNMKFSINNFSSKCDQIRRKLRIWSHLLTKPLTENFIFCAVYEFNSFIYMHINIWSKLREIKELCE